MNSHFAQIHSLPFHERGTLWNEIENQLAALSTSHENTSLSSSAEEILRSISVC
jgi:hypothetical protein